MYFNSLLLAAAIGLRVAHADFRVYTEIPIPTSVIPTDTGERNGFLLSVSLAARNSYDSYTSGLGTTYQSSLSSANSEIEAFAKTASNFSIPAAVTNPETTTTFTGTVPNWYSALPSKAKAFKEREVQDEFSVIRAVVAGSSATSGSTGGVMPTARPDIGAKFGVMAAAAAAAFL